MRLQIKTIYSPLNEHRHDHVDVIVRVGGLEHARAGRGGRLHRYLAPFQHRQYVQQVAAIEGDLALLAFDRVGINLILVVADLFRLRRDDELSFAFSPVGRHKLDPDDVAAVPGEDGRRAG